MENIAIIGSGPAGYTAAIYASRAGLSPLVFEGRDPGGQLVLTSDVENFPGFPDAVLGYDLVQNIKKQAIKFGARFIASEIVSVNFENQILELFDNNKDKFFTKTVIVATGSSPKWLGLADEKKLLGKGVSSCAVCDGFFYRDKEVAVVGGGDTAAEEAIYLSKICRKVTLLVRSSKMKASAIMQQRVINNKKIEIIFNTEVKSIFGSDCLENLELIDTNHKIYLLKVQALFVAIGHNPNTQIFEKYLELTPSGYIKTSFASSKTNIPTVFAAGDVQDSIYRQAITAAASGCIAALDAEKYLSHIDFNY